MNLPEKGDVRRAVEALNARIEAAMNMPAGTPSRAVDAGDFILDDHGPNTGDGVEAMRRMYGDLVDVDEIVEDYADSQAKMAIRHLMAGKADLFSMLASISVSSAALGALMERQRWTR